MGSSMLSETTTMLSNVVLSPDSNITTTSNPCEPYTAPSSESILTQSLISGGLEDLLEAPQDSALAKERQQQQQQLQQQQHQQLQQQQQQPDHHQQLHQHEQHAQQQENEGDFMGKLMEDDDGQTGELIKDDLMNQSGHSKRAKTG
jgi:hypothetical protein